MTGPGDIRQRDNTVVQGRGADHFGHQDRVKSGQITNFCQADLTGSAAP